jgi:thioredoxin-dependent peroxiredoxin
MAQFTHRGNAAHTNGELPAVGQQAPNFDLTKSDLTDTSLADFAGKNIVLNIFPSIDTSVCAMSVRRFNQLASALQNTVVLCISKDLPFAQNRFCGAEGITNVLCLSEYKSNRFTDAYHVRIESGSALIGLMARAVIVINSQGLISYTELVQDVGHEPDYEAALKAIQ